MPEMRTLATSQRLRSFLFFGIIITLVIIYVTTGESQTKNSPFYKRTAAMMDAKARGENAAAELLHTTAQQQAADDRPDQTRRRAKPIGAAGPAGSNVLEQVGQAGQVAQQGQGQGGDGQQPLVDTDESLKQRLKDAEQAAKKSADDRYRHMKDIEDEIKRDREEQSRTVPSRQAQATAEKKEAEKSAKDPNVAGRKKMPPYQAPTNKPKSAIESQKNRKPQEEEDPAVTAVRSILAEILARAPVTVFSKSYCPHSAKAKKILLDAHTISPAPYVVELDQHPQGQELQSLLQKITGRRTVPNVLVNGKTIGGGDEMELLWKNGELPARVQQIAGKKVEDVKRNYGYGEESEPNRDSLRV
ncbi:MAG: hypothetical protein M1828_006482 [Chrysothrix sp. TS-e1954]|nr:MAG: hypothetical protein M1828_006482 [Chrysothrix sp. TS-e1954]